MKEFIKPMLMAIVVAIAVYIIIWSVAGPWDSASSSITIVIAAIFIGGLVMGIIVELRRLGWLTWRV